MEDMDGPSKISRFLQQLQVSNVSQKHVGKSTRASSTCIIESDDDKNPENPEEPEENEELETAEDILTRLVELVTPAQAKEAAEKVI